MPRRQPGWASERDPACPDSPSWRNRVRASLASLVGDQRGELLPLVAITLTVIMSVGTLAVDLTALEKQGQTLQNAADAAAIAGVAEWASNGNQVNAIGIVHEIIAQNGVTIGAEVSLNVEFPSTTELRVVLTDNKPDAFLGGVVRDLVAGDGMVRDAVAALNQCGDSCAANIAIPPRFAAIQAEGAGDGYLPIMVGSRIYSINHHNKLIECVNRVTENICWPVRTLLEAGGAETTFHIVHHYLHDQKIYFTAWQGLFDKVPQEPGSLFVGCWDTTVDQPCPDRRYLGHAGAGSFAGIGDRLYLFASDRYMYCLELPSLSDCAGYSGGRPTALAGEAGWDLATTRGTNMDIRVLDNRFYGTLANDGVVYMQCYDLSADQPCSGYGAVHLNNTESDTPTAKFHDYYNSRLFFYRDSSGNEIAICSMGTINVECYDLTSSTARPGLAATLNPVKNQLDDALTGYFMGNVSYNQAANRAYFVSTYRVSETHCFDFDTQSYCGGVYSTTPLGEAQPYGFVSEGACMIGLGDEAIFFTIDTDMNSGCDGSGSTFPLQPCLCAGQVVWPPVRAENTEGVDQLNVRVVDRDGNVLVPADPNGWVDMLTEDLDLSSIPSSVTEVSIVADVRVTAGQDPWADGSGPGFVVGGSVTGGPKLVG